MSETNNPPRRMIDGFGRRISYVRLSVTDRCDLRCRYCMAETMAFVPRADDAHLEEIATSPTSSLRAGCSEYG